MKGLTDLIGKLPNEEAKQCKELTRTALQIIKLNAGAIHTLSNERRGRMRNDLGNSSNTFKALCKPPEKEGIDLFGENVAERLKEIKEMGRMGNDLIERKFSTGRPNFKSKYNGIKTPSIAEFDPQPTVELWSCCPRGRRVYSDISVRKSALQKVLKIE